MKFYLVTKKNTIMTHTEEWMRNGSYYIKQGDLDLKRQISRVFSHMQIPDFHFYVFANI